MPSARSGPTVAQRLICAQLIALRERAGMSVEEAGRAIGRAQSTVWRLESAQTGLTRERVTVLLDAYHATPAERDALLRAVDIARMPGWWHAYRDVLPAHVHGILDLESAASVIRIYAPGVIPDLLQTPGYARALLRARAPRDSQRVTDRRVELVLARQEHSLRRHPQPVRLWVLMEESVLHRPVGAPEVMREQLAHLQELTTQPGPVALQVIRTAAGAHPMTSSGSIGLLRFSHGALEDRLILRGMRTTVTVDTEMVSAYQAAMDHSATLAPPPSTPLPLPPSTWSI